MDDKASCPLPFLDPVLLCLQSWVSNTKSKSPLSPEDTDSVAYIAQEMFVMVHPDVGEDGSSVPTDVLGVHKCAIDM